MGDINVKILLQNLVEKIKEESEKEVSAVVDDENDVAVTNTQSLLGFSVSAVRVFQKAIAEVLAENSSAEVDDEAKELTKIALSYQKGTFGEIDKTLSNLGVEKYCDNFSNVCNVYNNGVVVLEEKIAESNDFFQKIEEAFPDNETLKGPMFALKGAIGDAKEKIRGFSQNKLGFKISRDKRPESFNNLIKEFLDAVCNLEKRQNAVKSKVADLLAAQEKAKREAEEAEKRKREELAREKVEKIANGLSHVKPSDCPVDDNQTLYSIRRENHSLNSISCERGNFERCATITLCQLVEQLALLDSPSGYNVVGVLKTNGIVAKDAQAVIVVDSGHKISAKEQFQQSAELYANLCANEKLLFSKKAYNKFIGIFKE